MSQRCAILRCAISVEENVRVRPASETKSVKPILSVDLMCFYGIWGGEKSV